MKAKGKSDDRKHERDEDTSNKVRVRATRAGLHGSLRQPGDVFHLNHEDEFSDAWMEEVDDDNEPLEDQPRVQAAREKRAKKLGVTVRSLNAGIEPDQVVRPEPPSNPVDEGQPGVPPTNPGTPPQTRSPTTEQERRPYVVENKEPGAENTPAHHRKVI